jgi:hypothetical protein
MGEYGGTRLMQLNTTGQQINFHPPEGYFLANK